MPHANQTSFLLIHASQLLTLRGAKAPRRGAEMRELGIVQDGALLIKGQQIAAVGTTNELGTHPDAAKAEEIDCGGRLVLPGFVDSHTHPAFAAPRLIDFEKRIAGASYEEISQAGGGIRSSLQAVREATTEQLADNVLRALQRMATQGTTTVEAKSGYGLTFESELKSLQAIRQAGERWPGTLIATLLGAHVVPPEYRSNPEGYVQIVCEQMIPEVAQRKLASYVDVFHERGAFTPDQADLILRCAGAHRLKTRVHVGQLTQTELKPLLKYHPVSLDHMDHVRDSDVCLLAQSNTVATLLPSANYFLGLDRFPPAREFIDRGVAVALATDYNPGTSPTTSMPFVLSVACTHMRMSPAEAITAATINGASALELQHSKGSLEPGKDADVAIFAAEDYRELPYWFGVNCCQRVFLKGTHSQPLGTGSGSPDRTQAV